MRNLAVLSIFSVAVLSMCAGLPDMSFISGGNVSQAGFNTIESGSSDLLMTVEAIPAQVKSGRTLNLRFSVQNNNPYDLRDVTVNAYDTCVLSGESLKVIGDVKANRSGEASMKLTSEAYDANRNCNIKFMISYSAQQVVTQDVVSLSSSEYEQRELDNTLGSLPISSFSQSGPLSMSIRFSDNQPFLDKESYHAYIEYSKRGDGILEVEKGWVKLSIPSSISGFSCEDYSGFVNTEKISFVQGRTDSSVCRFTASSTQPITMGTMTITANYTYKTYGSIDIAVLHA